MTGNRVSLFYAPLCVIDNGCSRLVIGSRNWLRLLYDTQDRIDESWDLREADSLTAELCEDDLGIEEDEKSNLEAENWENNVIYNYM